MNRFYTSTAFSCHGSDLTFTTSGISYSGSQLSLCRFGSPKHVDIHSSRVFSQGLLGRKVEDCPSKRLNVKRNLSRQSNLTVKMSYDDDQDQQPKRDLFVPIFTITAIAGYTLLITLEYMKQQGWISF